MGSNRSPWSTERARNKTRSPTEDRPELAGPAPKRGGIPGKFSNHRCHIPAQSQFTTLCLTEGDAACPDNSVFGDGGGSSGAAAQDGATALSGNSRTLLNNDQMLVVQVHYAAHESLPVHDHSRYPTVYVYLADSRPLRFSHTEAQPISLTRCPVKTGWFRVSPGAAGEAYGYESRSGGE